jgi:CubicO group peptidase (beta-lactamase class C family)
MRKMYITGAYVISKYSGSSYRDFVEERVLLPLRMTSSTLYPNRAIESGRFSQSWSPSRRRIPFFMPEHTADLIAGAGGVMSTVEEMVRTNRSRGIIHLLYAESIYRCSG